MPDIVGEVAVRVVADARNLDKEIQRKAQKAGDDGAGSFSKAWAKRAKKEDYFAALRARAKQDVAHLADDISAGLELGIDPVDLKLDFSKSLDETNKFTKEMRAEFGKTANTINQDMLREYDRALGAMINKQQKFLREKERNDAKANKAAVDGLAKAFSDIGSSSERMTTNLRGAQTDIERIGGALNRMKVIQDKIASQPLIDADKELRNVKKVESGLVRMMGKLRNALRRSGTGGFFDSVTNVLAGIVGVAQLAARGILAVADAIVGFLKPATEVAAEGMKDLAGASTETFKTGERFSASIAEAAASVVGLVAMAAAAAVAFGTLGVALGSVVVLVNALAGGLVIVGSGLAYATSAALVLGPALVAIGAAGAVAFLGGKGIINSVGLLNKALNETDPAKRKAAFDKFGESLTGMSGSAQEFVRALEPLLKQFNTMRSFLQERLFAGLGPEMEKLVPLISVISSGLAVVADAMNAVIKSFVGSATAQNQLGLFASMFEALGPIVQDLGTAFGNFLLGVLNFFSAIAPVTQQFTAALSALSQKFLEWTQSAEGRTAIQEFFQKAYDAAVTVWQIIVTLAQAFGALFSGAQTEGQGFLDKVLELAQRFRDWVTEVSEDGRLKQWLTDAKDVLATLWDFVKKVGQAFQSLNTPQNRKFFMDVVDIVGDIIGLFFDLIKVAGAVLGAITSPFIEGYKAVKKMYDWVVNLINKIKNFSPTEWLGGLGRFFAGGGVVFGPTRAVIGEAGPEAVIPLTRPLSMIDPSVRGMAAALRGQRMAPQEAAPSRVFNADITVNSPLADPGAVATQVVNRMAVLAGV